MDGNAYLGKSDVGTGQLTCQEETSRGLPLDGLNFIYQKSSSIINLTDTNTLGLKVNQTWGVWISSVQSRLTLCNPMDCSTPGLPVLHQLPEFRQTHVHWVSDAIQASHPLLSPSPPAFNLSQHQVLFQWVSSSHQVAKVMEFQLQHQSFQWIFRTDFP